MMKSATFMGKAMHKRGRFIVLEGLEGAGKSTAMITIQRFLESKVTLVTTREPGGTDLGESIRQIIKHSYLEPIDPKSELLLFYAARVQLLKEVIEPALQRGEWVLADRFELSTFAYQGGGRALSMPFIQQLSNFCLSGLQPDLLLFLDLPPEIGLERALKRGEMDRIETESQAFFERVYHSYHTQLKHMKYAKVIDATKTLEEVQLSIQQALQHYLDVCE